MTAWHLTAAGRLDDSDPDAVQRLQHAVVRVLADAAHGTVVSALTVDTEPVTRLIDPHRSDHARAPATA